MIISWQSIKFKEHSSAHRTNIWAAWWRWSHWRRCNRSRWWSYTSLINRCLRLFHRLGHLLGRRHLIRLRLLGRRHFGNLGTNHWSGRWLSLLLNQMSGWATRCHFNHTTISGRLLTQLQLLLLLVILCLRRLNWWSLDKRISLLSGLLDGRWRHWWRLIVDEGRRGHLLLHLLWAAHLHRSNRHCRSWRSRLVWIDKCLRSCWLNLWLWSFSLRRLNLFFLHLVNLGFVGSPVPKVLNQRCRFDRRCLLLHYLLHLLLRVVVLLL